MAAFDDDPWAALPFSMSELRPHHIRPDYTVQDFLQAISDLRDPNIKGVVWHLPSADHVTEKSIGQMGHLRYIKRTAPGERDSFVFDTTIPIAFSVVSIVPDTSSEIGRFSLKGQVLALPSHAAKKEPWFEYTAQFEERDGALNTVPLEGRLVNLPFFGYAPSFDGFYASPYGSLFLFDMNDGAHRRARKRLFKEVETVYARYKNTRFERQYRLTGASCQRAMEITPSAAHGDLSVALNFASLRVENDKAVRTYYDGVVWDVLSPSAESFA